jgi:hypothetical protein
MNTPPIGLALFVDPWSYSTLTHICSIYWWNLMAYKVKLDSGLKHTLMTGNKEQIANL